jgi:Tfp pilus assembly protein PilP
VEAGRISVRISAVSLAIALLALPGCHKEAAVGPTSAEFNKAREQLVARRAHAGKPPEAAPANKPGGAPGAAPATPGLTVAGAGFHYNPAGLRDPFRSFEWEQLKRAQEDTASQGPLEHFDISQLALVGIIWSTKNARALIQDPSGMSYIVAQGAKIGKNNGRVIRIDDNLVVVKETYVDFNLEETTKEIEMRIRSTEGG